jgi:hypothetical protein
MEVKLSILPIAIGTVFSIEIVSIKKPSRLRRFFYGIKYYDLMSAAL